MCKATTSTVLRAHKRLKFKIEAFSFTDIATTPPLRRRSEPTNSTPAVNGDNIASLRQKCAEKGLPTHGRRHVLVSRLQQHAQSQAEANSRQSPEARNIQPSPSESVFSATQLTQIQSLVSRSVEQAIAEISSNAARTAIEAMTNTIPQRQHSQPTTQSETASTNVAVPSVEIQMESSVPPSTTTAPYANGFNEVPAQFVSRDRSCYNNFEFQRKLLFIEMPPVRRKNAKGISNRNYRSRSTAANSDTESLRRQCTERGLPNHGQKNALVSRYNNTQLLRLRGQR